MSILQRDMLLNRCESYLAIQGKRMKSFTTVQIPFAPGVDLPICLDQQIFAGYIVGFIGDCSFKNVFEGAKVFTLINTSAPSVIFADTLSTVMGCYIVGYIVNWE